MYPVAKTFFLALWLCCAKLASAGMRGQPPVDVAVRSLSSHEKRALQYNNYVIYECASPLGQLRENWFADSSSPTGKSCYLNRYTCCGPRQEFTSCAYTSAYRWPGAFVNGVCSGYSIHDCCYVEDGYKEWYFSSCFDDQEKILANWDASATTCISTTLSNCCRTLQNTIYECASPLGPIVDNWYTDTSSLTGYVCYYNYISTCCGALQEFTGCTDASTDPWPGAFVNGVCSDYAVSNCCYAEDGYTEWPFSDCYDSQEKILANWNADATTCTSTSLSSCCRTRQEYQYSSCSGSSKPFPGKWIGGVCSGYFESDCCFVENSLTSYNFIACYDTQEMIEGQWSGGDCTATLLSQCCRSTNTTGNREAHSGASISTSGESSGRKAGVVIGIVIGVLVAVVIVAVVCLRCCSCQLCGKMNCAGNGKPQPTSNEAGIPAAVEAAPVAASTVSSETAPESTSTSEEDINHRLSTLNNFIHLMSKVVSLVAQIVSRG